MYKLSIRHLASTGQKHYWAYNYDIKENYTSKHINLLLIF